MRKKFYGTMIEKRIEFIVERAYDRVTRDDYDDVARARVGTDSFREDAEVDAEIERAMGEWNQYHYDDDWYDPVD